MVLHLENLFQNCKESIRNTIWNSSRHDFQTRGGPLPNILFKEYMPPLNKLKYFWNTLEYIQLYSDNLTQMGQHSPYFPEF